MDFLKLRAVLGLDSSKYESGLDKAKSMASSVGNGIKTAFGIGAKAIGAATVAVGAFAGASVKSYADYEQLVGGVSKLYGTAGQELKEYADAQGKTVDEVREKYNQLKEAEKLMAQQSSEAYKTAGMSANQYMETATSFSAALINSLGGDTVAAAKMTDVAMRAISDNVNTFGSDMGSVTNAFQGFAKQNYTMLDNLKLGYGGTKEEMSRLIDDANEYRASIGQTADLSMDSFADIVQAIQSVQEAQNIAGTTGREAMSTIEGSAAATKAAWQNVMTAIAGGGDLGQAFDGLVTSIFGEKEGEGFINQIIPRIETTMEGIGSFIEKAAPYITDKLPALTSAIVPDLINSAITLLGAFGKALIDNTPQIANSAVGIVVQLANGLVDGLPELAKGAITLIQSLGQAFADNAEELQSVGTKLLDMLLNGITEGIPQLISDFAEFFAASFPSLIDKLTGIIIQLAMAFTDPSMLSSLAQSAITIILSLANGLVAAIPQLISAIPVIIQNLVTAIVENAPMLLDGAITLIGTLAQSIIENLPLIIAAGTQIVFSLISGIIELLPTLLITGVNLAVELFKTLIASLPKFVENGVKFVGAIVEGIVKMFGSIVKAAIDLVTQFINSIKSNINKIQDAGRNIIEYVKNGLMQKIQEAKDWGKDLIANFIDGIKEKIGSLKEAVGSIAETISKPIHFSVPDEGPLSDADTYMPDMMKLFVQGIKDNEYLLKNQLYKTFDFSDVMDNISSVPISNKVTTSRNNDIINLLEKIANANRNVTIVLEGDADRLFRVVQGKSRHNEQITGQPSFE